MDLNKSEILSFGIDLTPTDRQIDQKHMVFALFVGHCMSAKTSIGLNFWLESDIGFIFLMWNPYGKAFLMCQRHLSRSRSDIKVTFKKKMAVTRALEFHKDTIFFLHKVKKQNISQLICNCHGSKQIWNFVIWYRFNHCKTIWSFNNPREKQLLKTSWEKEEITGNQPFYPLHTLVSTLLKTPHSFQHLICLMQNLMFWTWISLKPCWPGLGFPSLRP